MILEHGPPQAQGKYIFTVEIAEENVQKSIIAIKLKVEEAIPKPNGLDC